MVVDQDPHRVKTQSLDMVLNRLSPSSLLIKTDIEGTDASFEVPYEAITTDQRANDAQYIDAVVRSNSNIFFQKLSHSFQLQS